MPKMPTIGDRVVEAFNSPDFPAPGIYGTPSERSPQTIGDMIIKEFMAEEKKKKTTGFWPMVGNIAVAGRPLIQTIGSWLADKFNPGRKAARTKDAYNTAVNNIMGTMPGRGYPPEYMQKLVNILARGYGEEPIDVSGWEQKGP